MRDYDPARDDWTHTVQPRRDRYLADRGLCLSGREHDFASGECTVCEAPDPYEDRPSVIHPRDTRDDHICFDGCRHARTREGQFARSLPDWACERGTI